MNLLHQFWKRKQSNRDGFHFTIILDDTFNAEYKEITTLKIFEYVIVDDDTKIYEKIKDYKKQITNLIEI